MKAVVLYEYGVPSKLTYETNYADPQIADDEVLISAAATSLNPVDWKQRSGAIHDRMPLQFPAILGRDVSGIVRAIGSRVGGVALGDKVMALGSGTYAELVAIKAATLTHIPDGVDVVDAAALPLVVATGDQLIREACALQSGQTVIVTGALGSVGRVAVHSAKKLGAKVIAAVRKSQFDEAKSLGVAGIVALDDKDSLATVGNVDAVADTVSNEAALSLINHVRDGGVFGTAVTLPDAALHPTVRCVRIFAHPDPSKLREFADDLRDGKFTLPIAARYPLEEAAEAHADHEKGGSGGKVLLLMM